VRWQPVSPSLMARLVQHGQERHAPPDGQLLRYASGQPITTRRYDHLWTRIGRHLPWARTQQVSMHWIRHTTLTWVRVPPGNALRRRHSSEGQASRVHSRAQPRRRTSEDRRICRVPPRRS